MALEVLFYTTEMLYGVLSLLLLAPTAEPVKGGKGSLARLIPSDEGEEVTCLADVS